jgi:hypothetical protein
MTGQGSAVVAAAVAANQHHTNGRANPALDLDSDDRACPLLTARQLAKVEERKRLARRDGE